MKTPTLDKMREVHEKSQVIGEFLTWLGEQRCEIASYDLLALRRPAQQLAAALGEKQENETLVPISLTTEELLATYFDIDLNEAERERVRLLASIRRKR